MTRHVGLYLGTAPGQGNQAVGSTTAFNGEPRCVPPGAERATHISPSAAVVVRGDYLPAFGAYPFHTHSMACGRNCCWALLTLWRAPRQNRYWYS